MAAAHDLNRLVSQEDLDADLRKKALALHEDTQDMRWVMSSPRGVRFVQWLLDQTRCEAPQRSAASVEELNFEAGRRLVGALLKERMFAQAPQGYIAMLTSIIEGNGK